MILARINKKNVRHKRPAGPDVGNYRNTAFRQFLQNAANFSVRKIQRVFWGYPLAVFDRSAHVSSGENAQSEPTTERADDLHPYNTSPHTVTAFTMLRNTAALAMSLARLASGCRSSEM